MANFTILKDFVKHIKRFNVKGRTVEFKINPVPADKDPMISIHNTIKDIIFHVTADIEPSDLVGFTFNCKDFKKGQGWKSFQKAADVTVDDVWNVLSSIFQSNSTSLNTDTFCLGVTTVKVPVGTGNNRQRNYSTFNDECKSRNGIVTIKNSDNLCLPRALVVAMAFVEKDSEYTKVRKNTGKLQTKRAMKLLEDAAVVIPKEGAGIPELQKIQSYFSDKYKICVYQYGTKGRDVIFEGADGDSTLNLLFHQGHYNVINSLTSAFCCSYYCEECHKPYDTKNHHRCNRTCQSCQQTPVCQPGVKQKCTNCNRTFKSQQCFDNHVKPNSLGKNSVCSQITCCPICSKTIKTGRVHICGEVFCKVCKLHQAQDHLCYMQPDTGSPKNADCLFVFYDLETRQEKVVDANTVEHEPNLCVFKQYCSKCLTSNTSNCDTCGPRLQILKHNVIENFVSYLLNQRKLLKNIIVIAHNGQAFDHQFVLNYLLTRTELKPKLIMRGTKIISMTVGNVKFLDSLNYFPMALSKLPKTFGLDNKKFKKGYFPHLFNTLENANYKGPLPDIVYYTPDKMKEPDRKVFLAWYEQHKDNEFDMQRDLVDYCISDVEILAQACLKFREQLLSTGNVCPFTEACTIASACNKVFRRNFLKPQTIGIIPKRGYRHCDNQSQIATKWLVWEEHTRQINILHSAKQKEVRLAGYKVDGCCEQTKQVFEFHGCYFHGHPECYKFNRDKPLADNPAETLNYRYESTQAKTEKLRALGYEVIEKWECEFNRELRSNIQIQSYTENHPLLTTIPLNPRDAFYGGRTGNTKTYYKIKEGETINYIDVCSLYPFVCKNGKYPIGHPKVFVGDECPEVTPALNGIIKCSILPPQDLYHPVIPIKANNKLIFSLCNACTTAQITGECNHCDEDRVITGTWVIDEVLKAQEKGYTITKVHEFWQYNVEQYDSATKIGGLFTDMMNKFLKIKQQASGWPADCDTIESKIAFVEKIFNEEGIRLEMTEIEDNPGLRALAKLILNSFWGKLGQKENQPKTEIVIEPNEFFKMMFDPTIVINTILPINENTLIVNYEHKEESYDVLPTVNVCLAAYTTAQARLKLYNYLEMLEERVLYYDTDSVIYISRPGDVNPALGTCVGDMKDELSSYGSGSYITEFASGGPKNYAYIVYSPETDTYHEVCKVKGICIDHEVSKNVNFNTLKDMITGDMAPQKITYKIIRRTKTHEVITRDEEKIFKPTSSKRKFESYDSVPYGYKKSCIR